MDDLRADFVDLLRAIESLLKPAALGVMGQGRRAVDDFPAAPECDHRRELFFLSMDYKALIQLIRNTTERIVDLPFPRARNFDSLYEIIVHNACEKIRMGEVNRSTPLLEHIQGPELIFGLVGAVGTDLTLVSKILGEELKRVAYSSHEVRLSHSLSICHKYKGLAKLPGGPEDKRIDEHMKAGDDLRDTMGRGDAVVLLGVSAIREHRESISGHNNKALDRYAFILNSLKHPEEVETLKRIYGQAFYLISVYAPRPSRVDILSKKIGQSYKSSNKNKYRTQAEYLVEKDEKEIDNRLGQNVRDTFPLADVFIEMSHEGKLREQLSRFIEIVFSHPYHTPTIDEAGMFFARASALRSADLSRQVGAAIILDDGAVAATGCNEVPKAGGGFYWEGESKDYRDFRIGHDSSAKMKHEIVSEIFTALSDNKLLRSDLCEKNADSLATEALYGDFDGKKSILKDSRISSIIEYGRIVHAEMAAITDSARRGISISSSTMFCTTFPCHMCARHIISSGIHRVVYIEPYPKSMAKDLYDAAIRVDGGDADDNAVRFEAFIGIAPRRFIACFQMKKRKDQEGNTLSWDKEVAAPHIRRVSPTYLEVEQSIGIFLADHMVQFGISAKN